MIERGFKSRKTNPGFLVPTAKPYALEDTGTRHSSLEHVTTGDRNMSLEEPPQLANSLSSRKRCFVKDIFLDLLVLNAC